MSEIAPRFGKRVKYYRNVEKLSQEKLAELSGLHPTYIGQVERGEKNCTLETAEKIALGLGIQLSELLTELTGNDSEHSEATELIDRIVSQLLSLNQKQLTAVTNIVAQISELK